MYRLALLLAIGALTIAPFALADAPAKATIDPQAMALLQKVQKTMLSLRTYQAECDTTISYPASDGKPAHQDREISTIAARKPNLQRYVQRFSTRNGTTGAWKPDPARPALIHDSDGKSYWQQSGANYRIDKDTTAYNVGRFIDTWGGFYDARNATAREVQNLKNGGYLLELRLDGTENVEGIPCKKILEHTKIKFGDESMESWETCYISSDSLVRRKSERTQIDGKPSFTRNSEIKNIKINQPIAKTIFAYAPPTGVKLEVPTQPQSLLANGTAAPAFTATDKDGKPVSLADFKGKVVVVDFWASWCPPCRASMPHNQEVAKKLQAEGLPVVLLAVDNSEKRDAFDSWVAGNSSKLSALTFAYIAPETDVLGKLYKVTGIPTQYVIDKSGVIRASFVGYGGPSDDLENAVRKALKEP